MVTIETVYITAIIAIALVVIVVSLAYVGRLKSGKLTVKKNAVEMKLDAKADSSRDSRDTSAPPQPGKTVIDEDLLINSPIDVPRDADIKVRKTKAFGSSITVRDPVEEVKKDSSGG